MLNQPNILHLLTDQQHFDAIAARGNPISNYQRSGQAWRWGHHSIGGHWARV